MIIHICDAPAHGKKFSNPYLGNHPENKYEVELESLIQKCAQKKVEIIGIYINDQAKYCFEQCKYIYDKYKGKSFTIQAYNKNYLLLGNVV